MKVDNRLGKARKLLKAGRPAEALSLLQPMIETDFGAPVLSLIGEAMVGLGHRLEAADMFETAGGLGGPGAAGFIARAAELLMEAGQHDKAQLIALRGLQQYPEDPALAFVLITLFELCGETQLVGALKHRLVASDQPDHLLLAARLLAEDPHDPANYTVSAKLRALLPGDAEIRFSHLVRARDACDFPTVEHEEKALRADIARMGGAVLEGDLPHHAVIWLEDEALLRKAVNIGEITPFTPDGRDRRRRTPHVWGEKLRIGYVSGDFWDDHATMRLLGEVLTLHDRQAFEITLFCNTPDRFRGFDTGGRETWGEIVPIDGLDDAAAESLVRSRGIDILVDLKGYTSNHRCGLFNRQAAPVQVAWLGFPGSAIAVDCDYILGDRFTLPDASAPHFHEIFCRLPETYQPNETIHRPRPPARSRTELGLPEDAFVFASFNSPKKLTPFTLDLWAKVLKAAPAAHLAVMAEPSVRAAFERRGIAGNRIHPLRKCAYVDHIARAQAADLALDTFPCNGHTTTSDMLWAGVPVATMRGTTFAGRVSESLLHAIGLEDLVADDAAGFVALAAGIARSADGAAPFKTRIETNRNRLPLFDAERFCRHLEAAYRLMADRARLGLAPAPIDVPALPERDKPLAH